MHKIRKTLFIDQLLSLKNLVLGQFWTIFDQKLKNKIKIKLILRFHDPATSHKKSKKFHALIIDENNKIFPTTLLGPFQAYILL